MKLLLTIRTVNRVPKPNYLRQTVRSLLAGGVKPWQIYLVPTDPDVRWIDQELAEVPIVCRYDAPVRRTPNKNGIAAIDLLAMRKADWIVLSEDDLEWCANPLESVGRWLGHYATPDVLIYRFFAFDKLTPVSAHAASAPLREMRGSQAVALRASDAMRFAAWARQHPYDWRPKDAPFQDRPHDGFDKLLGYWALQDRPAVPYGLVSTPFFVRHLGLQSSIHMRAIHRDRQFGGVNWSYRREVPA